VAKVTAPKIMCSEIVPTLHGAKMIFLRRRPTDGAFSLFPWKLQNNQLVRLREQLVPFSVNQASIVAYFGHFDLWSSLRAAEAACVLGMTTSRRPLALLICLTRVHF
jgi:hypothetical protein